MENWKRDMIWERYELEWIPTSPHIPHHYSPYFYPMTGILGELRDANFYWSWIHTSLSNSWNRMD